MNSLRRQPLCLSSFAAIAALVLCTCSAVPRARADFRVATHMMPFGEGAIQYTNVAVTGPVARSQERIDWARRSSNSILSTAIWCRRSTRGRFRAILESLIDTKPGLVDYGKPNG